MYNVVLAGDRNEGRAYQSRVGLNARNSRLATTAGSIRGLRVALIHELPGFKNRLDRHAINAELRYAEQYSARRGGNVARIYPDLLSYEEALEAAYLPDGSNIFEEREKNLAAFQEREMVGDVSVLMTGDSSQFDAEAERVRAAVAELQEEAAAAVAEDDKAGRVRRSRCKTCGVLTMGPDDPNHLAEAHEEATPAPQPVTVAGFFGGQ